jgi:hypothetical protein
MGDYKGKGPRLTLRQVVKAVCSRLASDFGCEMVGCHECVLFYNVDKEEDCDIGQADKEMLKEALINVLTNLKEE